MKPSQWAGLALIVAVCAGSAWLGYGRGHTAGVTTGYAAGFKMADEKVHAEWSASNEAAEAAGQRLAREREREDAQRTQKATNERIKDAQEQARVAAANRAVLDGLRGDLADARGAIATASTEAVRAYATAATVVFEDCTRRYSAVAQDADGHAADALMFGRAWPAEAGAK